MDKTVHNCFAGPDATRESRRGRAEIVNVGDEPVVTVDWFGAGNYAAE
jgi:hypothetical protein